MSNFWFYRQRRSFEGPNLKPFEGSNAKDRSASLSSASSQGSNRKNSNQKSNCYSSNYSSTTTLQKPYSLIGLVPSLPKITIDIPALEADSIDNIPASIFPK